jgi:Ca2+-binding RTX toxin-like protein
VVKLNGLADDGGEGEADLVQTSVERLTGGAGPDAFTGTSASNTFVGGGGNDVLAGLAGNDVLRGGTGNDVLNGGTGKDRLDGSSGSDTLVAKDRVAGEYVICGSGADTALVDRTDRRSGCERVRF